MNYILQYDITNGSILSFQPDSQGVLKANEIYITEALWSKLLSTGSQYVLTVSSIDPAKVYDDLTVFESAPPIVRPDPIGSAIPTYDERITALENAMLMTM